MEHFLLGFFFTLGVGAMFTGLGPLYLLVVFMASIFIDIDHYFAYVKAKKNWSLSGAWKWFTTGDGKIRSFVEKSFIPFHSIEFIICLFGVLYTIDHLLWPVWLFKFVFAILLGCVFHIVVDLIYILYTHDKLYIKVSFIYSYFKNKSLLKSEHIERYNEIINGWSKPKDL